MLKNAFQRVWRKVKKPEHSSTEGIQSEESIDIASELKELKIYYIYSSVINQWNGFERQVDVMLALAIGCDQEIGFCLTKEIQSVRTKLIMIESLLSHRGLSEAKLKSLRRFQNSMHDLTKKRNRLVHDPFMVEGGKALTFPRASDIEAGIEITEKYLISFGKECWNKHDEFMNLMEECLGSVGLGPKEKSK